jgi:hypothetical protein
MFRRSIDWLISSNSYREIFLQISCYLLLEDLLSLVRCRATILTLSHHSHLVAFLMNMIVVHHSSDQRFRFLQNDSITGTFVVSIFSAVPGRCEVQIGSQAVQYPRQKTRMPWRPCRLQRLRAEEAVPWEVKGMKLTRTVCFIRVNWIAYCHWAE